MGLLFFTNQLFVVLTSQGRAYRNIKACALTRESLGRESPRHARLHPSHSSTRTLQCNSEFCIAGNHRVEGQSMYGLEGVKVLELGNMVSAAYATKLMADLGADVIKVEEPSGDTARWRGPFPGGEVDPEKSGLFLSLNTNKRSVMLDLLRKHDELLRLVRWADILIHNYSSFDMVARGIVYETFCTINPRLVMCSITPFGLTGPHKDYKAYDLTLSHAGGWAW